jgi:hypothetical protein
MITFCVRIAVMTVTVYRHPGEYPAIRNTVSILNYLHLPEDKWIVKRTNVHLTAQIRTNCVLEGNLPKFESYICLQNITYARPLI